MGSPREIILGQDFIRQHSFTYVNQDPATGSTQVLSSSGSPGRSQVLATRGAIRRTGSTQSHSYLKPLLDKNTEVGKIHKLPVHRSFDHRIPLKPNPRFPRRRPYPVPAKYRPTMKKWISDQLESGVIRPSESPVAAPVFFIPKKSGEPRPVLDSRDINANTVPNQNPTPNPDLAFKNPKIAQAKVLSSIDCHNSYNQVRIASGDGWKASFITPYGQYEPLVMTFGLTGAPGTFQRFMNHIFGPYIGDFVEIYLDDILIFSASEEEHVEHVKTVLKVLTDNHIMVNVDKCKFHVQEIEFLGHRIRAGGVVDMQASKVQAILDWQSPISVC
jgi:hypothetical protein